MPGSETTPPAVADHTLLRRIGTGSYGEVWLARNVLGTLRAVKIVYRRAFDSDRPYEREFNGILKFEPVSRTHPGFVDILHVGRNDPSGYFYYVMELADAAARPAPDGESAPTGPLPIDPAGYSPRTLKTELRRQGRLASGECVELGIALANALDHLHQRGLVHRDIKPANVIFVEGRPQLADIGLVTDSNGTRTHLGTDGYLPPEGAGAPQSDLYSLGKVLYELSTGLDRKEFPALPADLASWPDRPQFLALNEIISCACASDPARRYPSAAKMLKDLERLQSGARPGVWRQGARPIAAAVILLVALIAAFVSMGLRRLASPADAPSALSAEEKALGFGLLFNGTNLSGWTLDRLGRPHTNWQVADGLLRRIDNGQTNKSRLLYRGSIGDTAPRQFELRFEYRIAPGARAVVGYLHGWICYQIADDFVLTNAPAWERSGALAGVAGAEASVSRPAGEWNEARIVRRGAVLEHWLNGTRVVRVDLKNSDDVRERLLEEELKVHRTRYGDPATRPWSFRLGDSGFPVDFRRLRLRTLPEE